MDPTSARSAIDSARTTLRDDLREQRDGAALLRRFSDACEQVVAAVAEPAIGAATGAAGGLALLAVGALARGEQGPHSDLDLVLLAEREEGLEEALAEVARTVSRPLWDAGLRSNLVVHTPESWLTGAHDDLPLCTELLDARSLAGDAELVERLNTEAWSRYFGDARGPLLARLDEETQQRHSRYGGTVYLVEPDLKHGPGGLRDWSVTRWCLLATHRTADFEALQRDGHLGPRAAQLLSEARSALLWLRAALQLGAKRGQDRLVFQYQESIPPLVGLLPPGPVDDESLVAAVEEAMQVYFRAAHDMQRYGARVRARCRPAAADSGRPPRRIDERFVVADDTLRHTDPDAFVESPVLALEALALARDHDVPLCGDTFDAIAEVASSDGVRRFEREPEAQRRMLNLLAEAEDSARPSALDLANELGLLEHVIPEWGPIRGRMQHDTYHVYTVDRHTLNAVAMLKRIARGEHNKDFPLATALYLGLDDPTVLYLSTLVHDAGKADEGDQCEVGAVIARRVAERAGLSPAEVDRCAMLVGEHLTMPLLSQKRDLSDPLLISDFGDRIADRRTLAELYLLSLVDMAQVRPGNLSSWKQSLLDELYLSTCAYLRRGHRPSATRITPSDEPHGMPDRYYSLYDRELRTSHFALAQRLDAEQRQVALQLSPASGTLRLTMVARDRPGLLAHAAAVFDEHDVEVWAADIFTWSVDPRVAIDIFRVERRAPSTTPIGPEMIAAMEAALDREPPTPAEPPRSRARRPWDPGPRVPTAVQFDRDPSGERCIVDVQTLEGPGVLRRITRAFHEEGHEILLARCDTEADRVSDVFYVAPLSEAEQHSLRERLHRYLE